MDKIIGQRIARYQSDLLAAYCAEVENMHQQTRAGDMITAVIAGVENYMAVTLTSGRSNWHHASCQSLAFML